MSVSALGNRLSSGYETANDLTIQKWPIMTNQILIKSVRVIKNGLIFHTLLYFYTGNDRDLTGNEL